MRNPAIVCAARAPTKGREVRGQDGAVRASRWLAGGERARARLCGGRPFVQGAMVHGRTGDRPRSRRLHICSPNGISTLRKTTSLMHHPQNANVLPRPTVIDRIRITGKNQDPPPAPVRSLAQRRVSQKRLSALDQVLCLFSCSGLIVSGGSAINRDQVAQRSWRPLNASGCGHACG
jgi:hypothetical protein